MARAGHQSSSNSVAGSNDDQLLLSSNNIPSSVRGSLDSNSLTDFLVPYVNILSIVGLKPITVDASCCIIWFGHLQTSIVLVVLLAGYVMQYLTGFRRDRGATFRNVAIASEPNSMNENPTPSAIGETVFVFVVPSLLHFCGFLSAVYMIRIADNEHLQSLVERVFILCQFPTRLFLVLWLYILCGIIWLTLMATCIVLVEIRSTNIGSNLQSFKSVPDYLRDWAGTILIITLICHDLVQVVVLSSYAIQCCLLKHYLQILNGKLIQNTIEPIDWMREMCEFQKLLRHLNKRTAGPVCFFTILNVTYAIAGFAYLIKTYVENYTPIKMFSLNVGNILLWLIIALYPLFQGASLTEACLAARSSGHQIRIRPFVHHNTSSEDLNSVLLYSSSLRMSAKLFRMPIQGNYLFCLILFLIVVILAMGMCVKVHLGIS